MPKIFTTDFQQRIGTQKITSQGFILADIILARTGVLDYYGWQIKRHDAPNKIFKIYRPESSLNNKETMDSFKLAPFTVNHPSGSNAPDGMLDPSNVKQFAEGTLTEKVVYEDGLLKSQVLITTDSAQRALQDKQESSIGFFSSYSFVAGVTPDGEAYDGIQQDIAGNHVALVESGRSGDTCVVLDSNNQNNGDGHMPTENKLVVLQVAGNDCDMTEVSKLVVTQMLNSNEQEINNQKKTIEELTTSLATSDAKLVSMSKDLETAKKNSSLEALEATIDSRIALMSKAKKLSPKIDCKGKSDIQIMKEALVANNDKALIDEKSDDYIVAYFDVTVNNVKDVVIDALDTALQNTTDSNGKVTDVIAEARLNAVKQTNDNFIGNNLGAQ